MKSKAPRLEIAEAMDPITLDAAYEPGAILAGTVAAMRRKLDQAVRAQSKDFEADGLPLIHLIVSQPLRKAKR